MSLSNSFQNFNPARVLLRYSRRARASNLFNLVRVIIPACLCPVTLVSVFCDYIHHSADVHSFLREPVLLNFVCSKAWVNGSRLALE